MPKRQTEARFAAAIRTDLGAIFVSLELSRKTWLVTSLSPGAGEKMSKHAVAAGAAGELVGLLRQLQDKARMRMGCDYGVIVIQEAGLDGFWLHRVLEQEGFESWVVDPASIAVSRRRRRAKSDRIDGEALLRTLMAFKRGEPRVCAMARPPTPGEEDRRRIVRERAVLLGERIRHTNRIKGLLFSQGIADYEPLKANRRAALARLRTGDGRDLGEHMLAQIARELDRLEMVLAQIKAVEAERDALVAHEQGPAQLACLKGLGEQLAGVLWSEGLYRRFDDRWQVAAYCGLAATPWRSGGIEREQGISKAGNPRLRSSLVELAWLWLTHQPDSALARWFHARTQNASSRVRRVTIVALARKLAVALWKYLDRGEIPEGAVVKAA